jgi:DNA-binding CsgD family transcriptional regulator
VAEGHAFHEDDFDRSRVFDRPVDSVILATGFHSGCSVPLWIDGRVAGAVSLSAMAPRRAMTKLVRELEGLGDVLAQTLLGEPVALTPRERELLDGLEEGLRFKQIARRLDISEATAKTHARHLFRKLDATSRAEAVHAARLCGLLS